MIKKYISLITLIAMIFSFTTISLSATEEGTYIWSTLPVNAESSSTQENQEQEVEESNSLNLESESAILIEQTTGQVLYSHNIHEQLRPASVTKVMSILLIMESLHNGKISLNDAVPCSENASSMGGSQIWLDPKETLTVDEMLKAICVNSANDCGVQKKHKNFLTHNLVSEFKK